MEFGKKMSIEKEISRLPCMKYNNLGMFLLIQLFKKDDEMMFLSQLRCSLFFL